MKLFAIIKKEIMAVKNQRISLLLILLYPVIGTLLLGLAMTGTNFDSGTNIAIGITSNSSDLLDELAGSSPNYTFVEYYNVFALKDAVQKKQVTVGLEFIENPGYQAKVNIYYDNSSITSASIFTSMVKTNIENIAREKTLTTISDILQTTNLFSTNITDEIGKLKGFKKDLEGTDVILNDLEYKINSFDIDDLKSDIDEQKQNIATFKEKNARLKEILVSARTEFTNLQNVVNQFNSDIDQYEASLQQLESEMITQEAQLNSTINELNNLYSQIPAPIQATYAQELNDLYNLSNYISSWKSTIINVNNMIDSTNASQANLNSTINEFGTMLSELEQESAEIDYALNSSEQGIENLESKLGLFEETLTQARQLISESRISKADIENKITQSEELFAELLPKMQSFQNMDPQLLIQPIKIKLIPTQINSKLSGSLINMDATQLGVMVANSISIILILTCILLSGIVILSEKSQDIPLRTFMSDANPVTLTLGKLLGQITIALVETMMILIIAILFFGFPLSANFVGIILSVILISAAFISVGLLIGAYTKNQSTTILLSLLLIVPMLFVSGIIVPLELMPGFISSLAGVLPMTAANNLLIGVIVKSGGIYFIWKEIIVLSLITIVGFILFTLKKQ